MPDDLRAAFRTLVVPKRSEDILFRALVKVHTKTTSEVVGECGEAEVG